MGHAQVGDQFGRTCDIFGCFRNMIWLRLVAQALFHSGLYVQSNKYVYLRFRLSSDDFMRRRISLDYKWRCAFAVGRLKLAQHLAGWCYIWCIWKSSECKRTQGNSRFEADPNSPSDLLLFLLLPIPVIVVLFPPLLGPHDESVDLTGSDNNRRI